MAKSALKYRAACKRLIAECDGVSGHASFLFAINLSPLFFFVRFRFSAIVFGGTAAFGNHHVPRGQHLPLGTCISTQFRSQGVEHVTRMS